MRTTSTSRGRGWLARMALALVVVLIGYLVLEPRAPGDSAEGFLTGGLITIAAALAARGWYRRRGPDAGVASRWAAGAPDERDDRILTRALAVVGYVAILGSAVGAAASLGGVPAEAVLGALPGLLLLTLAVASFAIARRS